MARYIDADGLKEHLEDFSKWCRDGRKQGVDFVLDCPLPNIPTADVAPRAEWISIEERLPEPYTWVMVYNPNGKYTKIDTDEIVGGNWVRNCGKVTHWMPLPEPPKGD